MKLGKLLSVLGAIVYTSVFETSFWVEKAEAQSSRRPYIVFVNGWQNCCASGMNSLQKRLINEMKAEVRYVPYSNFTHNGTSTDTSTDERFLREGEDFINKQLDRNRPLVLIGHSFGGDSILKLLPRINRRIQFVGVIDPVSTGGVRSTLIRYTVPDTVDYFFNRWQENEPFPIDFSAGGSIRCSARIRCDQDEQQFVTHADGSIHRENCKWFETCKTKNRRVDHQELATDEWIQRIIGDRIQEQVVAFQSISNSSSNPCSNKNIEVRPNNRNLEFRRGQEWKTCSNYKFIFQNDGNLVLYNRVGKAIWATGTNNRADLFAVQADGNVVLYGNDRVLWATNTSGNPGAFLAIQSDGNVVIYGRSGNALWATGTRGR